MNKSRLPNKISNILLALIFLQILSVTCHAALIANYTFDLQNGNDTGGLANHATEQGTVTYGIGVSGSSAQLNGTNAYFSVAGNNTLRSGNYTVSAFIKMTGNDAGPLWGGHYDNSGGATLDNSGFEFFASSNGTITVSNFTAPTGNWGSFSTGLINDGTWHHIAATYDGIVTRTYIDAVLDGEFFPGSGGFSNGPIRWNNPPTNHEFLIGLSNRGTPIFLGASIDELKIYDNALSASAIANLSVNVPEPSHYSLVLAGIAFIIHLRLRKRT